MANYYQLILAEFMQGWIQHDLIGGGGGGGGGGALPALVPSCKSIPMLTDQMLPFSRYVTILGM
jgi:hypothetical protein